MHAMCRLLVSLLVLAITLSATRTTSLSQPRDRMVAVLSPDGDNPRITAVREAIVHWNEMFADLRLSIRFAEPRVDINSPNAALDAFVKASGVLPLQKAIEIQPPNELQALTAAGADVVVYLSTDDELISFARPLLAGADPFGKFPGFVALRSHRVPPLSLSNVARNVAAHELGHVLGLPHNSDPATLMCGRPAECRPSLFESKERRFWPLTDEDRSTLRRFHK